MATEISRVDRLLRKRNQCLQHQLDVRIKIFDKEFKMCKSRVNNEIRDCNLFYKTIRGVYPGLENYSHPDTRSMVVKQESKQRTRSNNSKQAKTRGSRYTVGDSRHIARENKSQIETSMYSTYTQCDKEQKNTSLAENAKNVDELLKRSEPEREDVKKSNKLWHRHGQGSVLSSPSPHHSTSCSTEDEIPENEHPITTLVRTMRQRILSAPPVRKVQFYNQGQRCYRPNTAIGCIQEQHGQSHSGSRLHSHKLKSNTSMPKGNSDITRPKPTLDQPHSLEPGLSSDKLVMEYMFKARSRNALEEDFIRRPKSAPPSYELLGKSPALPRQQVAGIMAEMESRRAATRALIDKSKFIQKQVKRITFEQGIITEDEAGTGDEI